MSDLSCSHMCDKCGNECILSAATVLVMPGMKFPIVKGSLEEPSDKTIVNVDEK